MNRVQYGSAKGDTLCPLGFHPQVRWPTRCKRCFRDYKDHNIGRRKPLVDRTSSSPNLQNLANDYPPGRRPSDPAVDTQKHWSLTGNFLNEGVVKPAEENKNNLPESRLLVNNQPKPALKHARSDSDLNVDTAKNGSLDRPQKLQIKGVISKETATNDVEFIIKVRKSQMTQQNNGTGGGGDYEKTDDTVKKLDRLHSANGFQEEVRRLTNELSEIRTKCTLLEKEKSEILLRRFPALENVSSKATGNEFAKLQKTIRELQAKNEDLAHEKLQLTNKMKNLTKDTNRRSLINNNFVDHSVDDMRSKLRAAEKLCESLMDENECMKKEIRELEDEIYELQDNFREEQMDEYTGLKKDLEQSSKNCRILSFKLKKVERRAEQLEAEKVELEKHSQSGESKGKVEKEMKNAVEELQSSKAAMSLKIEKLTGELEEVRKDRDKVKEQHEKAEKSRQTEVANLKKKISSLESTDFSSKRINEVKKTLTEKITSLNEEMKRMKEKHDELQAKHDKAVEKNTAVESDNKTLNSTNLAQKTELSNMENKFNKLRSTLEAKELQWNGERQSLQATLSSLKKTDMVSLNDAQEEINKLTSERKALMEKLEEMSKTNDDINNKLQDYSSISKVHRNLSADTTVLEMELEKTKTALSNADKAKKAELMQCQMRYEKKFRMISDEIQSIQNQVSRYKRDRDTYKHMLEAAQKTIGELKGNGKSRHSQISGKSDEEEESTTVALLEKQVSCMEDELAETRLEASRLKTELASEKTAWEIRLSEMQSTINELQEERMLASGRTKIPGLKVRMELAWQKERAEQQRIMQETATLARDLRQTLSEVERERAKESLEFKRKNDHLHKIVDEEKEDNKRKLIELQCDLMELRDAHAKLRTSNEKMRRERERCNKECDELRGAMAMRKHSELNEVKCLSALMEQIDDIVKFFPDLHKHAEAKPYTPTPPRRVRGPKSRETSPSVESKGEQKDTSEKNSKKPEKLETKILQLVEVAKVLQESKSSKEVWSISRGKKLSKRSSSVENDVANKSYSSTSSATKSGLTKKSLSLDHSTRKSEQALWGVDSNLSSTQSLDVSEMDSRSYILHRDSSVDSRLSGGSTKSDILPTHKKSKKGILKKLTRKLTKSPSVESNSSFDYSIQTSGSESSIHESSKHEKSNLKKKISDIFKKGSKSEVQQETTLV